MPTLKFVSCHPLIKLSNPPLPQKKNQPPILPSKSPFQKPPKFKSPLAPKQPPNHQDHEGDGK